MLKIKYLLLSCTLFVFLCGNALATPTFVGTFTTDDGDYWGNNPIVYSAREAAALIFGGSYTNYLISTNSSMDYTTITNTGWYSIIGVHGGFEYDQDYSLDTNGDGYGGSGWAVNDDISAYVWDNAQGDTYTMYVWSIDSQSPVPEPATMLLFGTGIAGLAAIGRRRK